MISFRRINLFTSVTMIFTLVSLWADVNHAQSDALKKYGTYESCVARYDDNSCNVPSSHYGGGASGTTYSKYTEREECRQFKARQFCDKIEWPDSSNRSECSSLLRDMQSDEEAAVGKCSQAGYGGNVRDCESKTRTCRNNIDIGSSNANDPTAAMNNLMRTWMMTQGAANSTGGTDPSGCKVVDQERERQRKEQIEDKIARLLEQNEDSVVKNAELDDEVTQRQEETEEKIREAEEEVNRKQIERQTRQQEEEKRIQKEILESQKKQFETLRKIDEKNMEISSLQFAQQQINIQYAKTAIDRKCEVAAKTREQELTNPKPAAGAAAPEKPAKTKFSRKEIIKIKAEVDRTFRECWDMEELGRTTSLKGLMDKRKILQADIDTLNRSIEDEKKAIELEKKALEDMKATMTKEEQNDLDNKFKKINTLSSALAKFKESIERKKKSQDQRIAARKEQIQRLILSKADVIYKEIEVDQPLRAYTNARSAFVNQCCAGKVDPRFSKTCSEVSSSRSGSRGYRTNRSSN